MKFLQSAQTELQSVECVSRVIIHISANNYKELIDAFNKPSFAVLRGRASFVSWPIRPPVAALWLGPCLLFLVWRTSFDFKERDKL